MNATGSGQRWYTMTQRLTLKTDGFKVSTTKICAKEKSNTSFAQGK